MILDFLKVQRIPTRYPLAKCEKTFTSNMCSNHFTKRKINTLQVRKEKK